LEKPFLDVLDCNEPDFPFCLGWANHSWTNKSWEAGKKFTSEGYLIKQEYPGIHDIDLHFNTYLKAFKDHRYITVDGKNLFLIFNPKEIPDPKIFFDRWNLLANQNGLKGFHFVGIQQSFELNTNDSKKFSNIKHLKNPNYFYDKIISLGFDAVNSRTSNFAEIKNKSFIINYLYKLICEKLNLKFINKHQYSSIIKYLISEQDSRIDVYPTIIPNWDRSPRSGEKASIWHNSTPELFDKHIKKALKTVSDKEFERRIIFLQSWNEWAEGNYVEPDLKFGKKYLDVLKENILTS
jgi:hypothetical protein